jgi:hypothetical protein
MTMGNNNNNAREEIDQAYTAVQVHVLPGLGDAWDEAGPAVVLVLGAILADVWIETGFETFDLIRAINGVQRLSPSLTPMR